MLAALRLSGQEELRAEVAGLLARAGLPTALDGAVPVDDVIAAVGRDKKRTAEGIGFVLVDAPGAVEHGRRVEPDSLRAAVTELLDS
jgi:3-dehydroquinate synthetase